MYNFVICLQSCQKIGLIIHRAGCVLGELLKIGTYHNHPNTTVSLIDISLCVIFEFHRVQGIILILSIAILYKEPSRMY